MQGSMMMGMGEALMEQICYDDKGRILNANLAEYKIPTSLDMPPRRDYRRIERTPWPVRRERSRRGHDHAGEPGCPQGNLRRGRCANQRTAGDAGADSEGAEGRAATEQVST
jgi:hypothetical protein